jgi:1-acyl-sn-glycerol-3-phosphate acyltransferase
MTTGPQAIRPGVFGAVLRRWCWRVALILAGGLTVRGRLPRGGCVVVANHSSHADTAAVLAALDAGHRPRVAAAADYWFRGGSKAWICRTLGGGFAVRRGGGGSTDLANAAALLRSGRAIVVFPEGTRSRTGELGEFRSGAARLAAAAGVPLVPVGITGTADLLPVHGRLRPAHTTVRIGSVITSAGVAEATAECWRRVGELVGDGIEPDSRVRRAVERSMSGGWGPVVIAVWAFLEAISWPLVPELALLVVLLAAPHLWRRLIPVAVVANLAGGLVAFALAGNGIAPPTPLTTVEMRELAGRQVAAEGAVALRHQPLSGIPFKAYAVEAGRAGVDPFAFAAEALRARGIRIAVIGLLLAGAGGLLGCRRQLYPVVLAGSLLCFFAGLARVVAGWS